MPDFYPFHAQIPAHDGMISKDRKEGNSYMELVHKVQMPLGHSESTDPVLHKEKQQKAQEGLAEIIHRSLWASCSERPAYILYQGTYRGTTQSGIIGLCDATQLGKQILPHEQIQQNRAATITDWLRTMNLQWTPVFLSYRHHQRLHTLQTSVFKNTCHHQYTLDHHTRVSLWCISEEYQKETIRKAVSEIPYLYIADGHHRAAACQDLTPSTTSANHIPDRPMLSILMADRDLKIYPYYRRIRNDQTPVPIWEILDKLKTIFRLKPCSLEQMFYQYLPEGHFLLAHKEACWLLQPLPNTLTTQKNEGIPDVLWLQKFVLWPICGISDPTSDSRIDFGTMNISLENFKAILQEAATEFILIPRAPSSEDVFRTADRREFMPPKSTSFEPKMPSGLVVYKIA
jgi:uncharacterized protein (DUF1015 family)